MTDNYRLVITNLQGGTGNSNVAIAEIEMHLAIGGADVTDTAENTVSAHSNIGSGYVPVKAIDDNVATMWNAGSNSTMLSTDGVWWEIDFTDDQEIIEYSLTARSDGYLGDTPTDWKVQRWSGDSWDTLETESTPSTWTIGETRTFEITVTKVAKPIFDPGGGVYTSGTTVIITCSTPSSTIYYTTDGSTPTTGSSVYSTHIEITDGMTIKAFATASGLTDSNVASETYNVSYITQQPMIFIVT